MQWNSSVFNPSARRSRRVLFLDIETMTPDADALEIESRFLKANGNTKDAEKKARQIEEKGVKLCERGALSDVAPLACVGFVIEGFAACVCAFPLSEQERNVLQSVGILAVSCSSEAELLAVVSVLIERLTDEETRLVGHNIFKFDLPKLRLAYARHAIPLPALFQPFRSYVSDTMKLFADFYTVKRDNGGYVSLEECAAKVGVTQTKTMKGAEVPVAILDGRGFEVALYNIGDVQLTAAVFTRLGITEQEVNVWKK